MLPSYASHLYLMYETQKGELHEISVFCLLARVRQGISKKPGK